MLFDLYDEEQGKTYEYWIRRVHFVAQTLNYSYFDLWNLNEQEFKILEKLAEESLEKRKEIIEEAKEGG